VFLIAQQNLLILCAENLFDFLAPKIPVGFFSVSLVAPPGDIKFAFSTSVFIGGVFHVSISKWKMQGPNE
jgi:hypothetical protein